MRATGIPVVGGTSTSSLADKNSQFTQAYTTQGLKLLQHTEVLYDIQHSHRFRPIQVQLAPTEACESDCPFCSVGHRPARAQISFQAIERCIKDFADLGAKAIEITGGGNPLLYRDKIENKNINDIIRIAASCGLEIGIITNSHSLSRIEPSCFDDINWIRISLIKLEEGKGPEDYAFCGFPAEKIGMSYIYYSNPSIGKRGKRSYVGTGKARALQKIVRLHQIYPDLKFIRIAPDASLGSSAAAELSRDVEFLNVADEYPKIFLQISGSVTGGCSVFDQGCYVGALRPFIASSPDHDEEAYVYICSCHTYFCGSTYDKKYALCKVADIKSTWQQFSENVASGKRPYEVNANGGIDWRTTCRMCCYGENNRLLHAVANPMEDCNFA